MSTTICPDCGAIVDAVVGTCPHCGSQQPDHIDALPAGAAEYACGHCRTPHTLASDDRPENSKESFANVDDTEESFVPLAPWNTVFLCSECHAWNWVTLDNRIATFTFPCPKCGSSTRFDTLGKRFALSKEFLKTKVIGDLINNGENLKLKCGHAIYFSRLLREQPVAVPTPPPPVQLKASTPKTDPPTPPPAKPKKKDTQPINIVPPQDK